MAFCQEWRKIVKELNYKLYHIYTIFVNSVQQKRPNLGLCCI